MNYQNKLQEIKRVKNLIRFNYPEGCCKITSQESELHAKIKCQLMHLLKSNDYQVWSECNFNNTQLRADLVAIHKSGISYCFEIVCSEKEKSKLKKQNNYPLGIIFVDANKFGYQTFKW